MKTVSLPVAYMPLVDAAPLIVAQEMGFAEAEGIALNLVSAPSWSSVRDMLAFGRVDAAHMLSPVPVAMAMGLGGITTPVSAVMVLSVNGNVIGVGRALEQRLRAQGYRFDFADARMAAQALARAADGPLVFGVPFPFSMHVELLRYWFERTELGGTAVDIRTVPPPMMAEALAAGEIDAFCVGEPWGSVAVDQGSGALLLPGNAIWSFAPEKVLGVRTEWAETEPHLLRRLMRSVWKAGQWLSRPDARTATAEILSRKEYLDVSPELIDRALHGRFTVSGHAEQREVSRFVEFHKGAASFPWRSQAKWMAHRLSSRQGIPSGDAMVRGAEVYRSDLYRSHMSGGDTQMPGASEKLEGSIRTETAVASQNGPMTLLPDAFFDGCVFDPDGDS